MIPLRDILPTHRRPVVTWAIIGLNVIAFAATLAAPEATVSAFAAFAFEFTGAQVRPGVDALLPDPDVPVAVRAITHMWLHSGLLHLAGNLWFLWIFGDNVEDRLGPVRYAALYLIGGFTALTLQVAMQPASTAPMLGASGAVAAVLGGYLRFYPDARIIVLVPIGFFPLLVLWPAKLLLGLWVALQMVGGAISLARPSDGGGVAWWAHIGGFALGFVLAQPLAGAPPSPPRRHADLLSERDPRTGEPYGSWRAYRLDRMGARRPPRR